MTSTTKPFVKVIGGTTVRIVPPVHVSEHERQLRHDTIVRAAAECMRAAKKNEV